MFLSTTVFLTHCPNCGYSKTLLRYSRHFWKNFVPTNQQRWFLSTENHQFTTCILYQLNLRFGLHLGSPRTIPMLYTRHLSTTFPATVAESTQKVNPSLHRVNSLGIQMLSKPLHKQIFCNKRPKCSRKGVLQSKQHLTEQGLWDKPGVSLPDLDVQLPRLQGDTIDNHFRTISDELNRPYLELAVELSQSFLPPMPSEWCFKSGWTRYAADGSCLPVKYPDDNALVFDVEVCVKESPRPILAVAVSINNWYSWVSERLMSGESFYADKNAPATLEELIPLQRSPQSKGQKIEKLIVGHNVSYDRARVREQYSIESSQTKFLDTLSLHTCVAGQTTLQKILWQATQKNSKKTQWEPWMDVSSPNSLVDVHWCHVSRGKKKINKGQRDVFVKGNIQDIRNEFQESMQYCAKDVFYTHEILKALLPQFLERYPHPVTFAGMLEMGTAYLPINYSWEQYIADAEYTYEEMEREMKSKLMALADEACTYMHSNKYLTSPWLCNLDWKTKAFRGKAIKNKRSMEQLLENIEGHFTKEEEEEDCQEKPFEFLISSNELSLPPRRVHLPGYPEWYRSLCMKRTDPDWRPGAVNVSAQTRITPYLLQMKWKGHPLYYHVKLGWGYIIPMETNEGEEFHDDSHYTQLPVESDVDLSLEDMMDEHYKEMEDTKNELESPSSSRDSTFSGKQPVEDDSTCIPTNENQEGDHVIVAPEVDMVKEENWRAEHVDTERGTTDDIATIGNGYSYHFFKIPHKDGADANCGNPLSKDYLPKMEDGTLTSGAGHVGQRILTLNSMMSFWRSARSRIMQQFVVWLNSGDHGNQTEEGGLVKVGAIVPQVTVAGTATRRAVEATWLTASNAKASRVGSEQKAMIQAPPGYHIVGADVDSQELWIAAVLGDVHFAGIHGSTAIGWMTLQGKRSDQSDVHSNTAKTIGISRDHAKILNYGRFYGAGKQFIELLLRKFNPFLTNKEVQEKAEVLYTATKGVRMYKLTTKGQKMATEMDIPLVDGCLVSQDNWRLMCDVHGYFSAKKLLSSRLWYGGSESYLFNKLEKIALSDHPSTPVLECSVTRALEKQYVGNQFQPSRINWVVQSSAVDYLHLLLVSCQWMFKQFDISGRFCISIHDEVRYLVKSEDRYRAALALQYANLFTRAMFAYKLGLQDLPMSVAFFSGVDIDLVLRKEATMDCKTPSNPMGMEKGHGIPNGEVLDIYQLLDKTNGLLHK